MRALLINLDRSPDRLAWMQSQAHAIGMNFERVRAVDFMDPEAAGEVEAAAANSRQSLGQVACSLSHRKCWKLFLESSDPAIAIFEDDAYLSSRLPDVLRAGLPPDVHLVKLEASVERTSIGARNAGTMGRVEIRRLLRKHMGTCGYIISRHGAEALLRETEEIDDRTLDALMFPHAAQVAGLLTYQAYPAVCIQERFFHSRKGKPKAFARLIDPPPFEPKAENKILRELKRIPKRWMIAAQTISRGASWRQPTCRVPFLE